MMFVENDKQNLPRNHNRPSYEIATTRDVELKRVMVNPGCSLNIIHLSMPEATSMSQDRITK